MRLIRSALIFFSAVFAFTLGLPHPTVAQSDTTRWTPELAMQYDDITDTEISPDGKHVAYVVREAVMDKTTSTFRQHIHVASVDGSFDVQYTRGEHSNFSPKWSPSGDRIAFVSTRTEKPQVHVMRLRGGEAYAVTDAETGVNGFQWGPGGERIAYTSTNPKSNAEKRREKEKRDVQIVNEEFRYAHLYVTEVKPTGDTTRSVQRLTEGNFDVWAFDWKPDGSAIAFSHYQPQTVEVRQDISTVPADSGATSLLVDNLVVDGGPLYSPGGKTVAFQAEGLTPSVMASDVYTVPSSGGSPTRFAPTPNRRSILIGWTSGGRSVLVREVDGMSTHVFAVPTDGDPTYQVTSGTGAYGYAYFGARPSVSRSTGRLAVTYENTDTPVEVYVGPVQDFSRRQVTSVNAEALHPKMGRTVRITWTSPEGTEIEGLLTYPVGYDGGRVPLVLDVHGGPLRAHVRTFTGRPYQYLTQLFAERGYAVLRPNPQGSSGYGKAFREEVRGDWGPGPFKDLMAGVNKTVEMGVAHPDSLAIMGWSYGGYMTAWAVTQTDRFEAASMGAGVSNLISMVGTSELPDPLREQMGGEFWERYETYEKNSPIYRVEAVSTPTQILHGAEDEVVPISQGREFYRALRRRGVPTEMVVYPRSPHGPREPKQVMDVTPRILDWFAEHLGRSSGETSSGQ